jgi:acetolactate synthase-1/2/3 large subunit
LEDKVDFVKFAESMGAKGIRITKKEEVVPALEQAISAKCPVVIDCIIDKDEKVFPMVSPGGSISEAFTQEDLDQKSKKQ